MSAYLQSDNFHLSGSSDFRLAVKLACAKNGIKLPDTISLGEGVGRSQSALLLCVYNGGVASSDIQALL